MSDDIAYFTAVRFMGAGRYEKVESATLDDARKAARYLPLSGSRPAMIYAVTKAGRSQFIESVPLG